MSSRVGLSKRDRYRQSLYAIARRALKRHSCVDPLRHSDACLLEMYVHALAYAWTRKEPKSHPGQLSLFKAFEKPLEGAR